MVKQKKQKKRVNKNKQIQKTKTPKINTVPATSLTYANLEYFRDAYCFFYDTGNDVYHTFSLPSNISDISRKSFACTCKKFMRTGVSCQHINQVKKLFNDANSINSFYNYRTFEKSHWFKLAKLTSENDQTIIATSKLKENEKSSPTIFDNKLEPVICYHGINDSDRQRFIERFTIKGGRISRGEVLNNLFLLHLNETEKKFIASGYITPKLVFEQSIWYRFAYHLQNEFQSNIRFMITAGKSSSTFQLNGFLGKNRVFDCILQNKLKDKALELINNFTLNELPDDIKEINGHISYSVLMNKNGSISTQIILKTINDSGQETKHYLKYLPGTNNKIFIDSIGLVNIQPIKDTPIDPIFESKEIQINQIPEFIKKCGDKFLKSDYHEIDPIVRELKIIEEPKEFLVNNESIINDWYEFNVNIPIGNTTIPLYEIIRQKQKNKRYIKVENTWINCNSKSFQNLSKDFENLTQKNNKDSNVKLTKIEFLRFLSLLPGNIKVEPGKSKEKLNSLIHLNPIHSDFNLKNLECSLRHYQRIGLKWLTFLAENNFGGLLCDDMGLGKTHQLMALMTLFTEKLKENKPFLVVCPTTVISHWQEKITTFAKALKPIVYHGHSRELDKKLKPGDVILTSYGIIRNDIKELEKINFSIAVFDEIQYLKNKSTLSYKAAKKLKFIRGFGLSGTPIENRLTELKSLLDMVLPGYLGSDSSFENNYIKPIEVHSDKNIQNKLNRIISPFVLRRLKDSVLNELPPKIEDTRLCDLSPEQATLYIKAVNTKGKNLQKKIEESQSAKDIPYIHIFALLQLLKQICNHPALLTKKPEDYKKYTSGKWELFKEILSECLNSGNKVVVFSQFLGMIDIISRYLKEENINHVILTGKSSNRGKIIKTFNEDENCRVFLGSLKAGGTGIDLVSASIVIHYDRWWNAAREDQATDRVHRIGQTRGVQVFKFNTKNTLEEKIATIIDRKRKLMNSIVKEDSADSIKSFSKSELYDLLSSTLTCNSDV